MVNHYPTLGIMHFGVDSASQYAIFYFSPFNDWMDIMVIQAPSHLDAGHQDNWEALFVTFLGISIYKILREHLRTKFLEKPGRGATFDGSRGASAHGI